MCTMRLRFQFPGEEINEQNQHYVIKHGQVKMLLPQEDILLQEYFYSVKYMQDGNALSK